MARIRTIKPSFFRSLSVAELPRDTRLTWIGIWTYVDDQGRGVDDARLIKAELWPLDDDYTAQHVARDLDLLEQNGSIRRYEVDGRRYFEVVKWADHQRIDRPTKSIIPAPPGGKKPRGRKDSSANARRLFDEDSTSEERATDGDSTRTRARNKEEEEGTGNGPADEPQDEPKKRKLNYGTPEQKAMADAVLNDWWESQDPRPPNSWEGVRGVVRRLVAAGSEPQDVRRALDQSPAPTLGALQVALGQQGRPNTLNGQILTDRDGPSVSWIPENFK